MNNNLIYTKDYYSLIREKEENKIIDILKSSESLNELVSPSIDEIIDKLILGFLDQLEITDISYEIQNEDEINRIIKDLLSETDIFSNIKEDSLSNNLYTITFKKLCSRIFLKDGHNDEKYILQSYIQYWLEQLLANKICESERFNSLEALTYLNKQTEMLHYFFKYLRKSIPKKWISNEKNNWVECNQKPNEILDSFRTFDAEYFKGYKIELKELERSSPWSFISKTTRYSDNAMFNSQCAFRSLILLENDVNLWTFLWDNLKLPLLQDVAFNYLFSPKEILNITKSLVKNKDKVISNLKHLSCILLKNFFQSSLKVTERLSFYSDSDRIDSLSKYEKDPEIIDAGIKTLKDWNSLKPKLYAELVTLLKEILDINEIEEWCFSYKHRTTPQNIYTINYNSEIKSVTDTFSGLIKGRSIEDNLISLQESFDLRKFGFFVKNIERLDNQEKIDSILRLLITFIKSDDFYWDYSYSPDYWEALRGLGMLLSLKTNTFEDAFKLIREIQVDHEGWKIDFADHNSLRREAFVFCGVILVLEKEKSFKTKKESKQYFKKLLETVISQSRHSTHNADEDYQNPLHLLYLVANQIIPDLKLHFEREIIENLDNLPIIIRILSSGDYELKPSTKSLLQTRVEKEFQLEKRKTLRNNQENVKALEQSLEKLDIKI